MRKQKNTGPNLLIHIIKEIKFTNKPPGPGDFYKILRFYT